MKNFFFDTETFSRVPIKNGAHAYAEGAEVMMWSYAQDDGPIFVWDQVNSTLNWKDELSDTWVSSPLLEGTLPPAMVMALKDPENLVWGHNAGMFDFVVLQHDMPEVLALVPQERRRDTLVQSFAHSMPGALDKLGAVLDISEDKRKQKVGKSLIHLLCKPQDAHFVKKHGTDRATKQTHPAEWQQFIEYAGGDIETMREAHRKLPQWNYRGKQVDLWHIDMRINNRGFLVDQALARNAIRAVDKAKAEFARRTQELTDNEVKAATQRDALLKHILERYGVELPDMQSDTLERRLGDENLPDVVKELIRIRLVASMNSVSKYKTLLKGVSSDGRLRGCAQFRGAGRTGRYAHRLFQFGNLPRPTLTQKMIEAGIVAAEHDALELVVGDLIMQWASSAIRGLIIAPKGKKLAIADLANIEGRMAAWLAGEEWKLEAFRDFDTIIGTDAKGKPIRKGVDLYIKAYASSFNVDPATIGKDSPERQIGKVEELMFQYGGGVGAWITGAATYGIDLDKMTDQVYPVLPEWAVEEAMDFLTWLYQSAEKKHAKAVARIEKQRAGEPDVPEFVSPMTRDQWEAYCDEEIVAAESALDAARLKIRMGLSYRTFVACDAIKRLWRRAHPAISSYWKELEETVKQAINTPGVTFPCRRVKIRRMGGWLRIGLPSGRALCYPNPAIEKDGSISFTGANTYTRKWEKVFTYGGKLFENIVQAASADQFIECFPLIEEAGMEIVVHVHDEIVAEVPESREGAAKELGRLMCSFLGWNEGLPLAAAGFETARYRKE